MISEAARGLRPSAASFVKRSQQNAHSLGIDRMTPDERSKALRQQADEVLDLIHLHAHCARIGNVIPTGSYFLDLMMYPDIDLYLPPTTPEKLLTVAAELSGYEASRTELREGRTGRSGRGTVHQASCPQRRLGAAMES